MRLKVVEGTSFQNCTWTAIRRFIRFLICGTDVIFECNVSRTLHRAGTVDHCAPVMVPQGVYSPVLELQGVCSPVMVLQGVYSPVGNRCALKMKEFAALKESAIATLRCLLALN